MVAEQHEGACEEVGMFKGYSHRSLSTFRLFLKVAEEGYTHPSVRIEKAFCFAHTSSIHIKALLYSISPMKVQDLFLQIDNSCGNIPASSSF